MQRAVDNADRAQTQLFEVIYRYCSFCHTGFKGHQYLQTNLTAEQRHSALMAENALLAEGTHRFGD